jgi:hypothetical protein
LLPVTCTVTTGGAVADALAAVTTVTLDTGICVTPGPNTFPLSSASAKAALETKIVAGPQIIVATDPVGGEFQNRPEFRDFLGF